MGQSQLVFAYRDAAQGVPWAHIDTWPLARIARKVKKGEWSAVQPTQRWLEVPGSASEGWGLPGWVRKDKLEQLRRLKPDATLEVVHPRDPGRNPYLRAWWTNAAGGRGWVSFVLEWPKAIELRPLVRGAGGQARAEARELRRRELELEGEETHGEAAEREAAEARAAAL